MKRQEILLNLTLLVIIAALVYLIYESKEAPRKLEELQVRPAAAESVDAIDGDDDEAMQAAGDDSVDDESEDAAGTDDETSVDTDEAGTADDAPPGSETVYAAKQGARKRGTDTVSSDEGAASGREVADAGGAAEAGANRGGQFGTRNLFRALLTPTPTPTPPPPTPAPTPDIGKALGGWRLLGVYDGKAMLEDVKASAQNQEGAIFEMPVGGTKQVDAGDGKMKTVTLKEIEQENPYNPEVVFTLEDTKAEKKINLDTEPAAAAPAPGPRQ